MKPIRLKKDNVLHTVHSGPGRVRLASAADVQQTIASPSGFGWPSCWVCTEKRMKERRDGKFVGVYGEAIWVPVEGYIIVDERDNEEDLQAECSHGGPRTFRETKVLSMPRKWGKLKKAQKRAGLVFFADAAGEPLENKVLV